MNHAIYFVGYKIVGNGATELLGLDPHRYSATSDDDDDDDDDDVMIMMMMMMRCIALSCIVFFLHHISFYRLSISIQSLPFFFFSS